MSTVGIASLILSVAALIGSAITVWVKTNQRLAVSEERNRNQEANLLRMDNKISSLEEKMRIYEDKILSKFDEIHDSIKHIEIEIAKINKN